MKCKFCSKMPELAKFKKFACFVAHIKKEKREKECESACWDLYKDWKHQDDCKDCT